MRRFLKVFLFFMIVGAGLTAYWILWASRSSPKRQKGSERATLVTVVEAAGAKEPVTLTAMGTVMPAQSVTLYPEVSGRIIHQSPRLVPGGRFRKGETLLRIDPVDYDLALKQQKARVVQARMELARERGLKSVAEQEWKMIQNEVQPTEEGRKLALREIQLENAQAALAAAESQLEQAERMRQRTVIRAPFNSVVSEEFVDRGQVLFNTSRIATLVATDKFWIQIAVPVDRLGRIMIPGVNSRVGSPAKVFQEASGQLTVERQGRVVKLTSSLDPKGKMARLLVEVDDPLGTPGQNGTVMPLLLGEYVKVQIEGPRVDDALALPRRAIRAQNRVWVLNAEKRLEIRTVETVWGKEDTVFVRGDLKAGESVVTSRIYAPVKGMMLYTGEEAKDEQ